MNREIKFRAIPEGSHDWMYGGGVLTLPNGKTVMLHLDKKQYVAVTIIQAETVGEYTGLKDKNGVEIYEGDIVKYNSQVEGAPERWVGPVAITWNEVKARFDFDNSFNGLIYCAYEIIGNVYDNPELLERS